jgi:hypothetical protein
MTRFNHGFAFACLIGLGLATASDALAQDNYPSRPVRMISDS